MHVLPLWLVIISNHLLQHCIQISHKSSLKFDAIKVNRIFLLAPLDMHHSFVVIMAKEHEAERIYGALSRPV